VNTLLGKPTIQVLFEFDPQELAHTGCRPQELLGFLVSEGLEIFPLEQTSTEPVTNADSLMKSAHLWYGYTSLIAIQPSKGGI
jgi:hypothetical protein